LLQQPRQAYLDRVRGLAVLVMIEAHVLDGWTRVAERQRPGFGYAMILGGFGAPLFLFLAGVSLVLSAESKFRKSGDFARSWHAVHMRGWQIFGLAFLFRLQSYILTAGYSGIGLLKVDILNVMGPALAFAGFAGGRVRSSGRRTALFAIIAIAIAMAAPIVRITPLLNWLPDPIEWYFRPSPTRTNFTLFPWTAFLFAGAVVGQVLSRQRESAHPGRIQLALAVVSLVIGAAGYGASFLPSIYERSEFWTTSPTFFFLRVGLIALLVPVTYMWEQAPWRGIVSRWSPIEELGRASLFVYWIHVEMVYGFISRPLRRNLSFQTAIVADVIFSVFLLGLVLLKNRRVQLGKADVLQAGGPAAASI
jgi:uncharacterized membrane protein